MSIFYTADLHFSHANIIGYSDRPWPDVTSMDLALINRWNVVVDPEDTVWVLGDVTLNVKNLWKVHSLHGHKYLVAGNHDTCWQYFKKRGRDQDIKLYLDAGFEIVYPSGIVRDHKIGDQLVTLSHLPYVGDSRDKDRYQPYRPIDEGQVNLCGHVHERWTYLGRSLNVGVDRHDYYPVLESKVIRMMKEIGK